MENRISVILTEEEVTLINGFIDNINQAMPFLVNLPPEEKKGGFKLGDRNLGFLEKGKDYITQSPEFMPSYQPTEEVVVDAGSSVQLTSIVRKLRILADKIEDTASIAGMEALNGILTYYNAVKQAAKDNVNGDETIYNDLRKRFPGRPSNT